MADIRAEHTRARAAFEHPALGLLHRATAVPVVAMLRACFTPDSQTVPVARLHQLFDDMLADLRSIGADNIPGSSQLRV